MRPALLLAALLLVSGCTGTGTSSTPLKVEDVPASASAEAGDGPVTWKVLVLDSFNHTTPLAGAPVVAYVLKPPQQALGGGFAEARTGASLWARTGTDGIVTFHTKAGGFDLVSEAPGHMRETLRMRQVQDQVEPQVFRVGLLPAEAGFTCDGVVAPHVNYNYIVGPEYWIRARIPAPPGSLAKLSKLEATLTYTQGAPTYGYFRFGVDNKTSSYWSRYMGIQGTTATLTINEGQIWEKQRQGRDMMIGPSHWVAEAQAMELKFQIKGTMWFASAPGSAPGVMYETLTQDQPLHQMGKNRVACAMDGAAEPDA
jgi:hypothetical protein